MDQENLELVDLGNVSYRLGYIPTSARKWLLARHVLRSLGSIEIDKIELVPDFGTYLVQLLRTLLECTSVYGTKANAFSAPYLPEGRPETFFLAKRRGQRLVGFRPGPKTSELAFHTTKSMIISKGSNLEKEVNSNRLLAFEIHIVTTGTSLSTKQKVNARCRRRATNPLWLAFDKSKSWRNAAPLIQAGLGPGENSRFWVEWYESILQGRPLPSEFIQTLTESLPSLAWDSSPSAVAALIEEIKRDFYTSITPPLVQLENGKWDVAPDTTIPVEPINFAIAQVEVALAAALGAGSSNGLTETSGETILIKTACANYRDMPSVVATSFWNACMGLNRNIGDIYPEDTTLLSLKNVLYTSVEALCEQDPLIRDRVAKLAALETRRMPTLDEREDLLEVPDALADDLTPRALEKLSEAVEIVASSDNPPRLFRAKLVNWLNKIGGAVDGAQKNEKRAAWLVKLAGSIAGWFFKQGD